MQIAPQNSNGAIFKRTSICKNKHVVNLLNMLYERIFIDVPIECVYVFMWFLFSKFKHS